MKVTAILGTPRKKGDCFSTIKMIEKSFNKVEETQIEYIFLSNLELGFCKSCHLCYTKGEEYCPNLSVTSELLNKMMESDIVIFASPVYEQHVTALMKNFYDNFAFMFHRPRFFEKKAILVSSTGGSGLKETLDYMKMCAIGWGFQIAGVVGVCGPTLKRDSVYREEVQRKIDSLVEKVCCNKKAASPSLFQIAMFRAMQLKAQKSSEKKNIEYEYWQERGWFHQHYYTEDKMGLFKRIFSIMMSNIMKKIINFRVYMIK